MGFTQCTHVSTNQSCEASTSSLLERLNLLLHDQWGSRRHLASEPDDTCLIQYIQYIQTYWIVICWKFDTGQTNGGSKCSKHVWGQMEKLTVLCSCKQNVKLKYKHRHTVAATGNLGFKINWKLNKPPDEGNHDRSSWSRGGEVHGSGSIRGGHLLKKF